MKYLNRDKIDCNIFMSSNNLYIYIYIYICIKIYIYMIYTMYIYNIYTYNNNNDLVSSNLVRKSAP